VKIRRKSNNFCFYMDEFGENLKISFGFILLPLPLSSSSSSLNSGITFISFTIGSLRYSRSSTIMSVHMVRLYSPHHSQKMSILISSSSSILGKQDNISLHTGQRSFSLPTLTSLMPRNILHKRFY